MWQANQRWQVTLCDPVWQIDLAWEYHYKLFLPFTFCRSSIGLDGPAVGSGLCQLGASRCRQ